MEKVVMCGRYQLDIEDQEEVFRRYGATPRFNADWLTRVKDKLDVRPSEESMLVYKVDRTGPPKPYAGFMDWGWFFHTKTGMISHPNTKIETVYENWDNEKKVYKQAIQEKRCLFPVTGWYEWQGEKGNKDQLVFRLPGEKIFSLAGLIVSCKKKDGLWVDRAAILTTEALGPLKQYHHRKPILIPREHELPFVMAQEISQRYLDSVIKENHRLENQIAVEVYKQRPQETML